MRVIIVGCGRLGADLAYRLFKRGYEVVAIDEVQAAFNSLPPDFTGRFVEGDVLNKDVLHRAGVETADAVAVVTNSDALNVVVGRLLKVVYRVPKVIVRNYNPASLPIFGIFGLQTVSSTTWGAQRVEEIIYHEDVRPIFSAGNGEVEIYEVTIPEARAGLPLNSLFDAAENRVAALTRGGNSFLPEKDTVLEAGDVVHVSATCEGIEGLRKRLLGEKEA